MYEQEAKLARVKKSCKTAKIVARILSIFTGICAALSFVGAGAMFLLKEKANVSLAEAASSGNLIASDSFRTTGILSIAVDISGFFESGQYAEGIAVICIGACLICILAAVIFGLIANTFVKLEKSESPFTQEILKSLKRVFVTITVMVGLLVGLGDAIMIGLVLWCIYCIMDYGCVLQEEVDDTI